MNAEAMRTLFDYYHWANRRVWACVEKLTDDQFTQAHDYSIGSLHNQAFHLMGSELYTIMRFQDVGAEMQALKQDDYPDRASIRKKWDAYIEQVDAIIDEITDEVLQETVKVKLGPEQTMEAPMWEILIANLNHAMNHRCQILALVGELGGETCEHGFWFYMMEQRKIG